MIRLRVTIFSENIQFFFLVLCLGLNFNNYLKEDFRYMKIHIFALRWKDEIRRSSQL